MLQSRLHSDGSTVRLISFFLQSFDTVMPLISAQFVLAVTFFALARHLRAGNQVLVDLASGDYFFTVQALFGLLLAIKVFMAL